MNTKHYINYFSEIKDKSKEEQAQLLEQARFETFAKLKLSGFSALNLLFSLLIIAALTVASAIQFGYPSLYNIVALIIGLGIQHYFLKWADGRLLKKGLLKAMSEQNDSHAKGN
ncbi:hypothetical protein [Glaciecola sp. SC05]|uniref:hypothetical protein n=1 Tax=Glaciecola sp. SC05 TaxID=1987355 RepID=UPI0035272A65